MAINGSSRISFLILLLAWVATPNPTVAQGVLEIPDVFGNPGDPVELQKAKFESQLGIRIDEMKRVCQLSDDQVRKLQVGAKGTVARSMVLWKKQASALQQQLGGMFAGGFVVPGEEEEEEDDEKEEEEEEEEANAAPINAQVFQMMGQMMMDDIPPHRQKIWKNVVGKVLTDEQRTRLTEADKARLAFIRKAGVMSRVQELDQLLRLSPQQRPRIVEVVDRVLGKTIEQADGPRKARSTIIYGDESRLRSKDLKDILSDAQLKAWETSEAEGNNPLAAAMQMGMGGGARRVMAMPGVRPNSGYLGISFRMNSVNMNGNAVIHQVVPGGPADKAGLQSGDVLLKLNGKKTGPSMQFMVQLGRFKAGDELEMVLERDGEEITKKAKLTKRE